MRLRGDESMALPFVGAAGTRNVDRRARACRDLTNRTVRMRCSADVADGKLLKGHRRLEAELVDVEGQHLVKVRLSVLDDVVEVAEDFETDRA